MLDDLLAQCRRRGIYVYLTLMNEMNGNFRDDSFVAGHKREEWVFDPSLAAKSQRYVREFLDRTNRYTGVRYADDTTIAAVEIMNEPHYPTLQDLCGEPSLHACAEAFDAWRFEQPDDVPEETIYPTYRYELLRRYLDRMCATVRATGCPAPVVWNLNWPRMINGHEDVFQAAADSAVDGVSFCCYPGQSDVANPFWANPADLSVNNDPLDMATATEMVGHNWALSFERDLSLWHSKDTFLHSDEVVWNPLGVPAAPATIAGCGNSPLVTYGGTGLYVLEFDGDTAELQILPDVRYTYPPWQRATKSLRRVCELDAEAVHTFELHLEGWTDGVEVARLEGVHAVLLPLEGPGIRFRAGPGQYRLTRGSSGHP